MDIRIITYVLILLSGLLLTIIGDRNKAFNARKYLIIFGCIILAAVSGLRGLSVGPDTPNYFKWFEQIKSISWSDVFNNFYLTYIAGIERDPGYSLFVKAFQVLSHSWQLFLITIAVFYYSALGVFLYKNTRSIIDVVFAFVLYIALFQIVALSGIRQQIAISLVFIALNYIKSKEMFKFILIILVASQFHISALVMIPFGLAVYLPGKATRYLYYIAIGLIPLVIMFGRSIVALLAGFLNNDYYSAYATSENSAGAFTYIFLSIAVSIAGLFTIKRQLIWRNNKIYYTAIAFMTFFVPLIMIDGTLIRLGQYFSLYMMIFIPRIIKSLNMEYGQKLAVSYVLIFLLIFLSLRSPFMYYFFWQ